jgi:hypothetical protein
MIALTRLRTPLVAGLFASTFLGATAMTSAGGPSAVASCMTGTPVEADITGVVVATTIVADTGFVALVRRDNGTSREVAFYGRNPNRVLNGTENTVEDAWVGDLPSLGGTYAITGAELEGADGPIGMSICADSSVTVLAEPPTGTHETTATESPAPRSTHRHRRVGRARSAQGSTERPIGV